MRRRFQIIGTLICVSSATSAAAQARQEALSPCTITGVAGPALCGKTPVPERREYPDGRRIELNIVVLKATGDTSLNDPLVFLAGGGVLPATRFAPFLSRTMSELLRSRDIVLVDQRGTGGSNPLHCTLRLPPVSDPAPDPAVIRQRVNACVAELASRADIRSYTTTRAMHDLEYVRSVLGYGPLNLWGMSYGTKAAREYLRLYPQQVRSMVLSGVVPRAIPWWGDQAANTDVILDEYYRLCQADASCRGAFPNARAAIDELVARLARQPVRMNDSTVVTASDIRRVVHNRLGESWSAVTIPLIVKLALDGDLAAFVPPRQQGPPAIPRGVFYAITCSEEFTRQLPGRIRSQAEGTFLGSRSALQHLVVCDAWPKAQVENALFDEVQSSVPTLILNGALDHITTVRYAESVAALLSRSRLLVLPLRGHNDFDPCLAQIIRAFVRDPTPERVNATCVPHSSALRFPTSKADLPSR
jgi:pimeloyl-ACP methyl ester carboxylesterase